VISFESLPTIASVAPMPCALFGIRAPFDCSVQALEPVFDLAREVPGSEPVHRCLVFAPDAFGSQLRPVQPDLFAAGAAAAPLEVPPRSILDYFSEKYDPWVTEKAISLIAADRHDLVVAPDHGAHPDPSTGGGAHGTSDDVDMVVAHFWAVRQPALETARQHLGAAVSR
jgi:hypothetical protein